MDSLSEVLGVAYAASIEIAQLLDRSVCKTPRIVLVVHDHHASALSADFPSFFVAFLFLPETFAHSCVVVPSFANGSVETAF